MENQANSSRFSTLKNNWYFFFRLYNASQVCHGNLDQFFQHENQPTLTTITFTNAWVLWQEEQTQTWFASWKTLLLWMSPHNPTGETILAPFLMVRQLSACMLPPRTAKTFQDYPTDTFVLYHITASARNHSKHSLGVCISLLEGWWLKQERIVDEETCWTTTIVPGNWSSFLRIAD